MHAWEVNQKSKSETSFSDLQTKLVNYTINNY